MKKDGYSKWGAVKVKNDEFCIEHDAFCVENNEFCIENDEFCIENDGYTAFLVLRCGYVSNLPYINEDSSIENGDFPLVK